MDFLKLALPMMKLASKSKKRAMHFTTQNEQAGKSARRFVLHFSRTAFKSGEKAVT
ncbi:hypothetical protein [Chlorobaculum limnaeum]|uniref:hypothetical protein n=1 Tax=Chlorobaculum limnaeum TaxID=274537 RepID=UPI0012ED90B2|nr:hypothetical protein [Chlorobaculum limnaeum]